ncbi:uncharacterized protein LOC114320523 [Camellia sinensis]|uniref:uncharacterized protein LOC114320523 n=1 Tax=Camellia sinensis TaxID=4442 RepID=UPI001035ED2B|nr:uncharacterized protein LOC114320523 [Camellia sinensis]
MTIKSSLSTSDDLPCSQPAFYRNLVGGLQYLTITRPDLVLAVNYACQHMQAPIVAHFALVKRLLCYVKGILSHGLQFSPGLFHLHAFTDANWVGDSFDRWSTSGFCVFLGPNLISWSAKKQSTASRSSTEVEYKSMASTTTELVWLQQLLKDLYVRSPSPLVLWYIVTKPLTSSRFHYLKDKLMVLPRLICLWGNDKSISSNDNMQSQYEEQLPRS